MVRGIDKFKSTFKDYSDQYVLIGGTACDNLMDKAGLDFRVTRDLDIVLIIEAIKCDFFQIFWDFIKEGNYEHRQKSTGVKQFYRFSKPENPSFPFMIELFSRQLDFLKLPEESTLTPIPTGEDVASLSAILLDNDYYDFIITHRIENDSLPIVTEDCLILLKAKAWMDLSERKDKGENIDSKNIKKHKNDIVRLCQLLSVGESISLPLAIKTDMIEFLKKYENSDIDPKSLQINLKPYEVFQRLKNYYQL